MKNIKYLIVVACALMLGTSSCTTDFKWANENPNSVGVGKAQAKNMLAPLIYDGAKKWEEFTWFWNNEIMQFTVFTGTTRQEHRYHIGESNWAAWYNFQGQFANNASHMEELAIKENNPTLEAMAITLKAYYLLNQSDMFGDIPCSESFAGRNGNLKPKYDKQQFVYEQLYEMFEKANVLYANDFPYTGGVTADGIYGNPDFKSTQVMQWRKFNNSLYLRALMRMSGRNSVMNVGTVIAKMVNDPATYPVFVSNTDNATIVYSGTEPYNSYFSAFTRNNFTVERRLTQQFVKMTVFKDASDVEIMIDPRMPIWGKRGGSKNDKPWKGAISGGTISEVSTSAVDASELNTEVFCRAASSYTMLDYAEVQFIMAEATLRGWIPGDKAKAKDYYEKAVTSSIDKWAAFGQYSVPAVVITPVQIADFLAFDAVKFDVSLSDPELFELIAGQKHLALYWTGIESWHEYRRIGYPTLTIGSDAAQMNGGILPARFAYLQTALGSNIVNGKMALDRLKGKNDMQQPVWWSKKAIDENYFTD